jgi:hypothetical protein
MNLYLPRLVSDGRATIGTLFHNNVFQCFILEDEHRLVKKRGETRIPAGIYNIGVRTEGGFHERYRRRFPWHKGMLHILDVPNFTNILIHPGNDESDTEGCLLPGLSADVRPNNYFVGHSVTAYKALYQNVIEDALAGRLQIEIADLDRED